MAFWKRAKEALQRLGSFLSGMVLPNIGAFIAWGLLTALFIPTGWLPNEKIALLVSPILHYLLPLLLAYTGGSMVAGTRGGVMGALAAIGAIVGTDTPMFLGAMIMGPLGGFCIKQFDRFILKRVPERYNMLIQNFSIGILGGALTILSFLLVGPLIAGLTNVLADGLNFLIEKNLLPFTAILLEPAKVLFLNNAIDFGILNPLGLQQAAETGKSLLFLLIANPGPGLGLLLAYCLRGSKKERQSAPGAILIQFFGGIHEVYFPYVLMNPLTLLGVIAGGATGTLVFSLFQVGTVATPSPGSIFAVLAMTPKGNFLGILLGILLSAVVSCLVSSLFIPKKD